MQEGTSDGFTVRHIAIQRAEEDNYFVLGLSGTQDGNGDALLLQRSLSFDEQDRSLGMDTCAVSVASGATVYGGLTRCSLDEGTLWLHFSAAAAQTLGVPQACQLRLAVDPPSVVRLRDGLRFLFSNVSSPPVDLSL